MVLEERRAYALESTDSLPPRRGHPSDAGNTSRRGLRPEQRRRELIRLLNEAKAPIVGLDLARAVGVSRQMLTQDIAVLRAAGGDIIATRLGYLLRTPAATTHRDVFQVQHDRAAMVDEAAILVDLGVRIVDVSIEHPVFGHLRAELSISSRYEAQELVDRLEQTNSAPLLALTGGRHSHTVEARRPELLEKAREELRRRGYLVA